MLEANQVVGGSTQVFRRAGNKFEFDVGTHYVGECGPGGRMQTTLSGLALTERINWLRQRPEGHCQIMVPGTTFQTPTGWDTYLERLVAAFPDEEDGLRRCVDHHARHRHQRPAVQAAARAAALGPAADHHPDEGVRAQRRRSGGDPRGERRLHLAAAPHAGRVPRRVPRPLPAGRRVLPARRRADDRRPPDRRDPDPRRPGPHQDPGRADPDRGRTSGRRPAARR